MRPKTDLSNDDIGHRGDNHNSFNDAHQHGGDSQGQCNTGSKRGQKTTNNQRLKTFKQYFCSTFLPVTLPRLSTLVTQIGHLWPATLELFCGWSTFKDCQPGNITTPGGGQHSLVGGGTPYLFYYQKLFWQRLKFIQINIKQSSGLSYRFRFVCLHLAIHNLPS